MPALPAVISTILQGILAAISAAPQVESIVTSAKALFASFVDGKLISVDQQNAVHAYVDAHWAAAKAGLIPPAWKVEPDPA